MKKILTILTILLIIPIVLAQEEYDLVIDTDVREAGITPDIPIIYDIEIIIEEITERNNKERKLNHLRERIAEMNLMLEKNKIKQAEKVRNQFEKTYQKLQNRTQVKEQKEYMDNLGSKISAIASQNGKLTEEQRQEIKNLIETHRERIKNEGEDISLQNRECHKVSMSNRQECCEGWATDNDIVKSDCSGAWLIDRKKCRWECGTNV